MSLKLGALGVQYMPLPSTPYTRCLVSCHEDWRPQDFVSQPAPLIRVWCELGRRQYLWGQTEIRPKARALTSHYRMPGYGPIARIRSGAAMAERVLEPSTCLLAAGRLSPSLQLLLSSFP